MAGGGSGEMCLALLADEKLWLPSDDTVHVLATMPAAAARQVAATVVKQLSDPECDHVGGAGSRARARVRACAARSPTRRDSLTRVRDSAIGALQVAALPTSTHLKWALQCVGHCFALELEEHGEDAPRRRQPRVARPLTLPRRRRDHQPRGQRLHAVADRPRAAACARQEP
jgi:hypothetical protein